MKNLLATGFIIIVAGIVYFTGLYTYFQSKEVNEELIVTSSNPHTMARGTFVDVDRLHKGSGNARIYQDGNMNYLRLESFNVTNGPDLYVYMTDSTTPTSDIESLGKYVSLGLLKGNSGNQTYVIPASAQGYETVVIWCQRYGVLFTYAVMQ